MISFNNLGSMGHVGNQMFQYSALRGIAKNKGYGWSIPPKYRFGINYPMRSSIYEIFSLDSVGIVNTILTNTNTVTEKHYHFDQDLFDNCPDDVDLNGYFQSYKYFDHIKDELLNDFHFKSAKNEYLEQYVTIHVRRGDYVNQPNFHPVCSAEYYAEAKKHFAGEKFLVISDDPDWCAIQEVFADCSVLMGSTAGKDLQIMSRAKGNIIANSSFSWWGAYLNKKNPTVIAPKKWFGSAYAHQTTKDLLPEEWIQI